MNRSVSEIASLLDVTAEVVRNIVRAHVLQAADNTPAGQLLFDEGAVELIRRALWPSDPPAEHARMTIRRTDATGIL